MKKLSNPGNIQKLIRELLIEIGENPNREGLIKTPERIERAYKEWFRGYNPPEFKLTTFSSKYSGIVIRKQVPFMSWCEHHMSPYTGFIDFAYLPDGKVIGISKIILFLQWMAARLTIQEDLTDEIVEKFSEIAQPKGVMIIITGYHTCETSREVKNAIIPLITSSISGIFKKDFSAKNEVLKLLKND